MDLGIGLPISAPGRLSDWARRAETAGFDTLALLDRLTFDNPEPLIALAALAGATTRIRLQTQVLLGPLRATALLAKQVATLDHMSDGRFVLGLGIGGRDDDHAAAHTPINRRGRILDQQLTDLRSIWQGQPYAGTVIGPRPATPTGPAHPHRRVRPASPSTSRPPRRRVHLRRTAGPGRTPPTNRPRPVAHRRPVRATTAGLPDQRRRRHARNRAARPPGSQRVLRLHRPTRLGPTPHRTSRDHRNRCRIP